jgi:hypothetical protein
VSKYSHLMQENINIRRFAGVSHTGSKSYEPPRGEEPDTIKGRLEWQRRKVLNDRGEEALSEAVLFTPIRLKPGDLVIVDGKEWPVVSVAERKGLYGKTDHWEVRL